MSGSYGSAYTQGLQQYTGKEKVVQSVVTLKHYFAYSIESYSQPGSTDPSQEAVKRTNIDVKVSAYDLAHTFFPAWEQTIKEGKALGAENTAQLCVFTVPYACPEPVLADHRFHTKTQLRICALHIVQA